MSVLTISCSNKTPNSDNTSTPNTEDSIPIENKLSDSLQVTINSTNLYEVTDATEADFIKAQTEYKASLITDTLKYPKKNNCLTLPISDNSTKAVSYCDTLLEADDNPDYRM